MLPVVFGENLLDDFFGDPFESLMRDSRRALYGKHAKAIMKTDIRETDHAYELDVDLPGFKKEDLQAEVKDGYLTIQASKGLDKDEKNAKGQYIRRERYAGACSRSFYVGQGVRQEDIRAKFENGILQLTIPKQDVKELPESRYIAIE